MNFNSRVKRIEKLLTSPRAVPEEALKQIMYFSGATEEEIDAAVAERKKELCRQYGDAALEKIRFLIYDFPDIKKPANAGMSDID